MELNDHSLNGSFYIDGSPCSAFLSASVLCWDCLSDRNLKTEQHSFDQKRRSSEETNVTLIKIDDKNLNQVYQSNSEDQKKHTANALGAENHVLQLREIIGIKMGDTNSTNHHSSKNPCGFTISFVKRKTKHRWRVGKVHFSARDPQLVQLWVDRIRTLLDKSEFNRPKYLMVFINPVGGKKKAPEIYRQKVAPFFDLAGIHAHVIMTERANHARDIIMECDLSKVDGLISVGGDGMFTEILHGLMARTYKDEHGKEHPPRGAPLLKPSMRMGIIPAGSTDTVSWSLQGRGDPTTAALHIIIGDTLPMDVGTLHQGEEFIKYHVSLLAYGFYGDVLIDSELHRWMGPRRYDWAGLKKFINHRSYEGEFSYIPSAEPGSHPRDGVTCKIGCDVCSCSTQSVSLDKHVDFSAVASERQEWKTIQGRFLAINTFLISCRCRFSEDGPSPYAHLGDGYYDVVVIHDCSRANYFKHLYRCTQPGKDQFALPKVEVLRVKAFKFRPLVDDFDGKPDVTSSQNSLKSTSIQSSSWNCDGEIVEQPAIEVMAHRQVVQMFARGIEDELLSTSSSPSCFNPGKDT